MISETSQGDRFLRLAGEGGGLDLYRFERAGAMRFSWDRLWQVPDENGRDPPKTSGWREREYATLIEAVSAAPAYWPLLMPVLVHPDYCDELWTLATDRLSRSRHSFDVVERCRERWEHACRREKAP
jgi:hypothetical protein